MSCISQAKDFLCHWRMTPFPVNDLLKMKCYQNNQRFLWRAAYIYTVYTLYYTVCTLNFKLCESLTAPPTCVSLFLSQTQGYTGPISVSFAHSIAPYVQLSDKWKKKRADVHACSFTQLAARAAASLHRRQACGCYRSSPCLLSKV